MRNACRQHSAAAREGRILELARVLLERAYGPLQVDGAFCLAFSPFATQMLETIRWVIWDRTDPPQDLQSYVRAVKSLEPETRRLARAIFGHLAELLGLSLFSLEAFLVYGPICPCGNEVTTIWPTCQIALSYDRAKGPVVQITSRDPQLVKRLTGCLGPEPRRRALRHLAPTATLQEDWPTAERHFKGQSSRVRARTWAIWLASQPGGGEFSTGEAVAWWNRSFPHCSVSMGQYERDRKRLLGELSANPEAYALLHS